MNPIPATSASKQAFILLNRTIAQVDEPVNAANQNSAADDVADGHRDEAGEEGCPRQRCEIGGAQADLRPHPRRPPGLHQQAERDDVHIGHGMFEAGCDES